MCPARLVPALEENRKAAPIPAALWGSGATDGLFNDRRTVMLMALEEARALRARVEAKLLKHLVHQKREVRAEESSVGGSRQSDRPPLNRPASSIHGGGARAGSLMGPVTPHAVADVRFQTGAVAAR